jgi:hypothetical protein
MKRQRGMHLDLLSPPLQVENSMKLKMHSQRVQTPTPFLSPQKMSKAFDTYPNIMYK